MSKKKKSLALMLCETAMASAETIGRRTLMMASGRCSPAEYQRMLSEKVAAAQATGSAMLSKRPTMATLLAPWHGRATRNAKRLRKRR